MTRFGTLVRRVDERGRGVDLPLMSVSQTLGVVRRSELTKDPPRADSLDQYKICRAGDIVFNKMSVRDGAMGVAREDGLVTYHYEVMRPLPGADPRYVVYLMKSEWFTGELIRHERGIGAGGTTGVRTTEVPFSVLRTIDAPIPDPVAQRAIADYLDAESAQKTVVIEYRLRQRRLIDEREFAMLSSELVPIGVGMIPLRFLASLQTGLTVDARRAPGPDSVTLPYLRVANVQPGWLELDSVTELTVPRVLAERCALRVGDVLMTEGGDLDKLGRGTMWRGELPGALHQNHVFAVRPEPDRLDAEYLSLLTRTAHARVHFEKTGTRTTNLASTNSEKILALPIPDLSVAEQKRFVRQVNVQLSRLGVLRRAIDRQIHLIQERRHAVITAAVTGQLEIPGVAA